MKTPGENPLQGKLFMTAREILATHDPNQPDRLYHGTDISVSRVSGYRMPGVADPRGGEWTGRDRRTDDVPNHMKPDKRGNFHPQRPTNVPLKGPWARHETDTELYARKRGESNRTGLTKSIKAQGVKMPIMLATETQGATGKPNVAGGHHRLAVMAHLNPDQLLPVMPVNHVLGAHAEEAKIEHANETRTLAKRRR